MGLSRSYCAANGSWGFESVAKVVGIGEAIVLSGRWRKVVIVVMVIWRELLLLGVDTGGRGLVCLQAICWIEVGQVGKFC